MRHINPAKAGFAVGVVLGLWHSIWVTLVAVGLAKPIMDFVLRLHFIELNYQISPFAIGPALTLIVITFCLGAAFGLVFALVWNWLSEDGRRASVGTEHAA